VRLAVLFGSQPAGDTVAEGDVDTAVEFDPGVTHDRRLELFLPLVTDPTTATGLDDVGLADTGELNPLVGSPERLRYHRAAFERLAEGEPSLGERADRVGRGLSEQTTAIS